MTTHTEYTTDSLLTGSFRDRASAERPYDSLLKHGYSKDEINVIMSDDTRKKHFDRTSEQEWAGLSGREHPALAGRGGEPARLLLPAGPVLDGMPAPGIQAVSTRHEPGG